MLTAQKVFIAALINFRYLQVAPSSLINRSPFHGWLRFVRFVLRAWQINWLAVCKSALFKCLRISKTWEKFRTTVVSRAAQQNSNIVTFIRIFQIWKLYRFLTLTELLLPRIKACTCKFDGCEVLIPQNCCWKLRFRMQNKLLLTNQIRIKKGTRKAFRTKATRICKTFH